MTSIPRRSLFELSLHSDQAYDSPFADVEVTGEFTAPDGQVMSHPGFHDGAGIWRLRFAPGAVGEWQYRVHSNPPNPDLSQAGRFTVTESDARGFLRSVPGSNTGFRFENGEDVYLLGDTTYDLFGMDYCGGDVAGFIARRAAQGYTHLRIRVPVSRFHPPIGHCDWQTRRCWPWGGSEQSPRFDLFNLDWFRSVDRTVEAMGRAGLGIEMIMEAWGFEFPFNHRAWFTAEWEALWMRYLIARYDAYACVWFWTPLNEYEYHNNGDYNWTAASDRWALRIARWIKATGAHGHPVAMHNGPAMPPFSERFRADPEAVDTIMFQTWGDRGENEGWLATGIDRTIAESLAGWPGTAVLAEWGYERDDDVAPLFPAFEYCDRSHNRRGGWRGAFGGLSIANGFEFTWSPSMVQDRDMPGCADLVHIRTFMTDLTRAGPARPADVVVDDRQGGTRPLALRGAAGLAVYLPAGGGTGVRIAGDWTLRWFDPRTGAYAEGAAARDAPDRLSIQSLGGADGKGRPHDWVAWLAPTA
jgi:hypothetical protein